MIKWEATSCSVCFCTAGEGSLTGSNHAHHMYIHFLAELNGLAEDNRWAAGPTIYRSILVGCLACLDVSSCL